MSTATATSSAWNVTRYNGQLTFTVRRFLNGPDHPPEFLRTSSGALIRFRTYAAASDAADQANKALEVAA